MNKTTNQNQQIQTTLTKYGQPALEIAKKTIHDKKIPNPVQETLNYFIEETWPNTNHPALIALCSEAVGGNIDATNKIGAAVVLLTGAADIHDDIIDKSRMKSQRQTAYDRFGRDLVLLAGDALLFKGMLLLHEACEEYPTEKRHAILNAVTEAFFKIGNVATRERFFRAKRELNPDEFCRIISAKGSVSEGCAEVGGIIGDGKPEEIRVLRRFGATLGYLMTMRNEFADMHDSNELENRMKNEILPLPLLYALQDGAIGVEVVSLLQEKISLQSVNRIVDLALNTNQVQKLQRQLLLIKESEEKLLNTLKGNTESLKMLLDVSVDYLPNRTVVQMFPAVSSRVILSPT